MNTEILFLGELSL